MDINDILTEQEINELLKEGLGDWATSKLGGIKNKALGLVSPTARGMENSRLNTEYLLKAWKGQAGKIKQLSGQNPTWKNYSDFFAKKGYKIEIPIDADPNRPIDSFSDDIRAPLKNAMLNADKGNDLSGNTPTAQPKPTTAPSRPRTREELDAFRAKRNNNTTVSPNDIKSIMDRLSKIESLLNTPPTQPKPTTTPSRPKTREELDAFRAKQNDSSSNNPPTQPNPNAGLLNANGSAPKIKPLQKRRR